MMTPADKLDFATVTTCHICGKEGTHMVRDHDHLTGNYRGAAHNKCNLRLHFKGKKTKGSNITVPVVFHNLRGYDAHLIAPALGRRPGRVSVIANNMTKYVSFSLALHRQPPVHVGLAGEAGSQPTERRLCPPGPTHYPHGAAEEEGGLPLRPLRRARTSS